MKYLLLYLLVANEPTVPFNSQPTPIIVSVAQPGHVLTDPGASFYARGMTCRAWAERVVASLRGTPEVPKGAPVSMRLTCENIV